MSIINRFELTKTAVGKFVIFTADNTLTRVRRWGASTMSRADPTPPPTLKTRNFGGSGRMEEGNNKAQRF